MKRGGIVLDRVRLLIRQVGATVPVGVQGRQQRIAQKLGISPSMLSKLEREQKSRLQDDTIKAILDALDLDPAFLFDESLGAEPDYRQFVRVKRAPPSKPPPPHWEEFAEKWPRFRELTPAEREWMQRAFGLDESHEITHWTDWIPLGTWMLARRGERRPSRQKSSRSA